MITQTYESFPTTINWRFQAEDYDSLVILRNGDGDDRHLTKQLTQIGLQTNSTHSVTIETSGQENVNFSVCWNKASRQWQVFHTQKADEPARASENKFTYRVLRVLNNDDYHSALFLSCANGKSPELQKLLTVGVNLCSTTVLPLSETKPATTPSCDTPSTEDSKTSLSVAERCGITPLHIAVIYNRLAVVKELIDAGAPIDAANEFGNTPIHNAVIEGYDEIFRALLEKAQESISDHSFLNLKNASGYTPFHLAVIHQRKEIIKVIIATGQFDLTLENEDENTLLGLVLIQKSTNYINFLLTEAKENKTPQNYTSWLVTSLEQLIKSDCEEKGKMLNQVLSNEHVSMDSDTLNKLCFTAIEEDEFEAAIPLLKHLASKIAHESQDEQKKRFASLLSELESHALGVTSTKKPEPEKGQLPFNIQQLHFEISHLLVTC